MAMPEAWLPRVVVARPAGARPTQVDRWQPWAVRPLLLGPHPSDRHGQRSDRGGGRMSNLVRRRPATAPGGIEGVFEEWLRALQLRRPFGISWDRPGEDLIRVDEYRDGNTEVIRAELPGIDPDEDLEVTVADGMLRISAERKIEQRTED